MWIPASSSEAYPQLGAAPAFADLDSFCIVQSTTRVKPFICTMPMRLDDGWNQIQFNLADFTRRAYGACWALWHVCTDACSCAEPHAACSWLRAQLKCPH